MTRSVVTAINDQWESALVTTLERGTDAQIARRCPDLADLLAEAAEGLDLNNDANRRQLRGKRRTAAARIPDAAARDQFADRIAHKARITEDVVRAEIRKAAVNRQTAVTTRELP